MPAPVRARLAGRSPDLSEIPARHTAAQAGTLLATGASSAVALVGYCLERITELDGELGAVLALDEAGAFRAAADSDRRRATGRTLGPLDGVPVLVKDSIECLGLPGTAGSRALLASPVDRDAALVERLRGAGLVVLGATNLSEWMNFRSSDSVSGWSGVRGQTRNPHDLSRSPSGSSSGSAVAVAAGFAPLTVGSETDGSIVAPASQCGVVGVKPSLGAVPLAGCVPLSPRQDVAGPLARTVADAAALHAVLAGAPPSEPLARVAGLRMAAWRPEWADGAVAENFARVLATLAAQGARITVLEEPDGTYLRAAEQASLLSEFAAALPAYLRARRGAHPRTLAELIAFNEADAVELSRFGQDLLEAAAGAVPLSDPAYLAAREFATRRGRQILMTALDGVDVLLAPTTGPAGLIGARANVSPGGAADPVCVAAVAGAPIVTLPAGAVDHLPVGVSLHGPPGSDTRLLAIAAAVEAALAAGDANP